MDRAKFKDQAYELRNMMNEINDNTEDENIEVETKQDHRGDSQQDVNILNLPPRSQVHEDKKTKVKWKISYPLVRLLLILFILIVMLLLTYQLWGKETIEAPITEQPFQHHPAGEKVKIKPNS
ncbi:hypothetical protein [Aquibacillus sediminis]|uniref:hypothetical protein n=1 Tax=Aquibacillus sediminis TaxID=2574734 RepID=UPI001109D869|nr:hypothetical protein [Aquibacillus sediminis]